MSWQQTYHLIEKKRITEHLRNTEAWMLAKDCSHLNQKLQKARKEKIELLHKYWLAENYPKNTEFDQCRLPFIKDKFGTPCAMAYIIEESGGKKEKDLIKLLHETCNNVFLKDVTEGPVIEWLKTSGISHEEACQIQPSYPTNRCEDKDGKVLIYSFIKPPTCVRELPPPPTPICPEGQDDLFGFMNCIPRRPGNGRIKLRQTRRKLTRREQQRADTALFKKRAAQVIAARKARKRKLTERRKKQSLSRQRGRRRR